MIPNNEHELKLLLERDSYQKILQHVGKIENEEKQINYYFDTPNLLLEKKGITLRIRKRNTHWLLCLKVKNVKSNSSFVSSVEFESEITYDDFQQCVKQPSFIEHRIPNEGRDYLKELKNELKLLGSIRNNRYSIQLFDNILADLDHSIFPNNLEAYELEIEDIKSENEVSHILDNLSSMGLEYSLNSKSKYKRFVETLYV